MSTVHPLKNIIVSQKKGISEGIYSVCSANEYVIEAAMEKAAVENSYVLIEATANQVNQYGGYTGMKPADFKNFVYSISSKLGFPVERIILGGDHLGPLTWKSENSDSAMEKAYELVREYVLAGFTKIHIDPSMHLGNDDPSKRLESGLIAERGAVLCEACEAAFNELVKSMPDSLHPVYVVGSEVPIPGGSQESEEGIQVTRVSDFEDTVKVFKEAFLKRNLVNAWENVIAVVVQPGVEFGDEVIHEYNREKAKGLCSALEKYPNLVFEGHSTDYQNAASLKEMVEDGIAILKVGPALTFALREALFALNYIENELFKDNNDIRLSRFIDVLDDVMLKNPENWKKYYHGTEDKIRLARKYSFSDRCRYYLPFPEVQESISLLLDNLKKVEIPLTLISQYMPLQFIKVRNGLLKNDPLALLKDRVVNLIDDYYYAIKH